MVSFHAFILPIKDFLTTEATEITELLKNNYKKNQVRTGRNYSVESANSFIRFHSCPDYSGFSVFSVPSVVNIF
jgi:hypothetical protein